MVQRTVTLPVGPDELWPTLTEPGRASRWLGGQLDWQVVEGAPLHFLDADGTRRSGTVGPVEPGRSLSWTWWPDGDTAAATEVTWTVEPDEDGTTLTVTESPTASARWSPADDAALGAWASGAVLATA